MATEKLIWTPEEYRKWLQSRPKPKPRPILPPLPDLSQLLKPPPAPRLILPGTVDTLSIKLDQLIAVERGVGDKLDRLTEVISNVIGNKIDRLIEYTHMPVFWGQATGGTASKLIDYSSFWEVDIWDGYIIAIIRGVGSGQVRTIASNTIDSITVESDFVTKPDNTSVYVIWKV